MRVSPCVAGGAREGDGVADLGEAGDVGQGALEAKAPTPPSPASGGGRVREGVQCSRSMPRSAILRSNTSIRSSRCH
jgi:hypothetical protein